MNYDKCPHRAFEEETQHVTDGHDRVYSVCVDCGVDKRDVEVDLEISA